MYELAIVSLKYRTAKAVARVSTRGETVPDRQDHSADFSEDVEIAQLIIGRLSGGPDIPLASVAVRCGIELEERRGSNEIVFRAREENSEQERRRTDQRLRGSR